MFTFIFLVLLILKVVEIIAVSWWIVCLPLIIGPVVGIIWFLVTGFTFKTIYKRSK